MAHITFESHEEYRNFGLELAKDYKDFIPEHLSPDDKASMAIAINNAFEQVAKSARVEREKVLESFLQGKSIICEANTTADIPPFDLNYLGMVSYVYQNLSAFEVVHVRGLVAPEGKIFYRKPVLDSVKGSLKPGTELAATNTNNKYQPYVAADLVVDDPSLGTGDGTKTTFSATLQFKPVIPGTVTVIAGTIVGKDDGSGNISGDGVSGTINYSTGQVSIEFSSAPAKGEVVKATYRYDQESNSYAEIKFKYESEQVKVMSRKIGASWTSEFEEDVQAYFGISLEPDMVSAMSQQAIFETEAKIHLELYALAQASGAKATWSVTPPSGVSDKDHMFLLKKAINQVDAAIAKQLGYIPVGNKFLLCGTDALAHVGDLDGFEGNTNVEGNVGSARVGTLNKKYTVYYNPQLPDDVIVVGIKPADPLLMGFGYFPYKFEISPAVPEVVNNRIDPFTKKKALRSREAFKAVNARLYGLVTITS
ncbi:Major capsid protein Gp23 [Balnearium lithotrophicum]|uniref:Major capsid protein Gp23 n=1 Tax=Balnearium lithotrophicum TaxID=223788 RepID=A0A521CJB0_9BACT|nr:hypothetical protein [Balnearium lithotrophicum]SMO59482.1 Major capsid protein Gp23 [Balnearium lithotrophicum]